MPIEQSCSFGVIEIDENNRMIGFKEKPAHPKPIPGDPEHCLVSMGNYIFDPETLYEETAKDNENPYSSHDFGKDIIPELFKHKPVFVYDFSQNKITGEAERQGYWRDVGDLDTYWQAHMDLLDSPSKFSLYNPQWPLHTFYPPLPPVKYRGDEPSNVQQSLICAGTLMKCATIKHSVIGFECKIGHGSVIENSILIGKITVGANCHIKNTIIDKNVIIHDNQTIGFDTSKDAGIATISKGGIRVIKKGSVI
jgi:glucose-1-phosphate adenylyltransferase